MWEAEEEGGVGEGALRDREWEPSMCFAIKNCRAGRQIATMYQARRLGDGRAHKVLRDSIGGGCAHEGCWSVTDVTPRCLASTFALAFHKHEHHSYYLCIVWLETWVCNILKCACFIIDCLWNVVGATCRCNMSFSCIEIWQYCYKLNCCNKGLKHRKHGIETNELFCLFCLFQHMWYLEVGVTNV
jgi:hypothetical protein